MPRRSVVDVEVARRERARHADLSEQRRLRRLRLVLEEHDEHVWVAHELDRAAAEVAALLRQPEVRDVHDGLRPLLQHRRPAEAVHAAASPSRRTVMRPSQPAGSETWTPSARSSAIA